MQTNKAKVRITDHALAIWFVLNNCNCAAVIGSANRNPPRSFRCLGVAQPSVVRDMRWLDVLHGAAHANWGLSIPPWGLKNQLVRKSEKCNTFHAKLGFSWLRVAKTSTPLDKVRPRQRESKLILGGSAGGLFFRLFFASFF